MTTLALLGTVWLGIFSQTFGWLHRCLLGRQPQAIRLSNKPKLCIRIRAQLPLSAIGGT
jgi:hypothetical protein